MLYHDKNDVSEGVHVNKTSASKECLICYHCFFLNRGFRFYSTVLNDCRDALMVSIDLKDIAILNIYGVYYHCIIS